MHARLTYLSFLSFAACLVSSCASDAPENNVDVSKGAELSFAVSSASRDSETPLFNAFAVYGDMKFMAENNSAPTVTFNKTLVEYKGGSWTYDGKQYWFPNHEHTFVAVAPVSVLEAGAPRYSNSGLSFTYTLPTTSGIVNKDGIHDILAATHRRLYDKTYLFDENGPVPVTLRFQHILSMVNISLALDDRFMKADEFVNINKLEFSGLSTKALFNILPASRQSNSQTDDIVIDVTGHDGDAKLIMDFGDAPKKLSNNGTYVSIIASADLLMMLPQEFAADSKTKITVTYTVNGDNEAPRKFALLFKDTQLEPGKNHNYRATFMIDKAEVQLQKAGISDWAAEELGSEAVSD